jgi:uncharacterized protein (TIGR03066 family)
MKQAPHRITKKPNRVLTKPPPNDHGALVTLGTKGKEGERKPPRVSAAPWRWAMLALCLLLTAGGTWAVFEFSIWSRIPHVLVGKWVVQGGEQDGATFDFYRNGTMRGRINVRGKEGIIDGRVRVEGDSFLVTTRNPRTRRDEVQVLKIEQLTRTRLDVKDPRGVVMRMEKAE